MAWGARSGLKRRKKGRYESCLLRLNGLGSPFGIETGTATNLRQVGHRLNGLGSPFGIETRGSYYEPEKSFSRLNGLGSPFGIETIGLFGVDVWKMVG